LAVTVTGETYQPFEPLGEVGFREASGTGGVRSTVTVTGAAGVELPATSVARKTIEWVPSTPSLNEAPFCQAPPSTLYWVLLTPEVASESVAVRTAGEIYQLFDPSGADGLTERVGGVLSRRIVPLDVAVFPALSVAVAVRLYTPSMEAVKEEALPLIPRLATPELASVAEAEAVTGPDLFQPFEPFGEGSVRVRAGATESTLMEA
jgi:hypothetical protein